MNNLKLLLKATGYMTVFASVILVTTYLQVGI